MFTGIIEEMGRVKSIHTNACKRWLEILAPTIHKNLGIGDSVAVSGVCLTAVDITKDGFADDLAYLH
jgi:riboflavin synthase